MKRCLLGASTFALALAVAAPVHAQTREVTGRVTEAVTGTPLPEVSVGIVGQLVGVRTNATGVYRIRVPATGAVNLTVRAIGYKRQDRTVQPGDTAVNFGLAKDVLELEGVTVTGAATTVERRNATSAVAVVNSDELNRVPHVSIENALQAKVLGATISMNNGAPGGGGQIQIRGASSLIGKIDPLYVVDGVIISNDVRSNKLSVITSSLNAGEENGTNRLADINPNDIENIEVLKGSVASAIYGSQATNGVVVITTKRGRAGAPRFEFTQRVGTYQLIRDRGERHYDLNKLLNSATVAGNPDGEAAARAVCTVTACPYHDYVKELYGRTAPSLETVASLNGGAANTKYYASADQRHDAGTATNTGANRQSFRVNVDQTLGSRLTASVGSSIMRSFSQRGISNNDNTNSSPLYAFAYTPSVLDLKRKDASGNYPINPFAGGPSNVSNPFQTFDLLQNNEDVYRLMGNANINYSLLTTPSNDIRITALAGADRSSNESFLYAPAILQFERPGTNNGTYPGASIQGNGDALYVNSALNATWQFNQPRGLFGATTAVGLQRETRSHSDYNIIAQGLIPSVVSATGAVHTTTTDGKDEVRNLAYYASEELLTLNERLLLSGAVRAERSSVNGDPSKMYYFPRVGASYRVPAFLPHMGEFKLRVTQGQAGNQPAYGDRFLTLANGGQIGGQTGLVQAAAVGNPLIHPERLTETEYGGDFSFFSDRAHLEVTHYRRNISDLLVRPLLAPSSGVNQEIINGGTMLTQGNEVGLTLVPIERPSGLTWTSRTTWQQSGGKITGYAAGVLPFTIGAAGGFGPAYGHLKFTAGNSVSAIYGNVPRADGSIARDTVLADANPHYQMGFSNDFAFGNWSISSLVDYRRGGTLSNLTLNLTDEGQTTWDFDKPSPDQKVGPTLGDYRYNSWNGGRNTLPYLSDGSFVKIREITLSYDLPNARIKLLQSIGAHSARLSLGGNNLFIISPYNGYDPEVNNGGNQVVRFVDLAPYPPNRSIFFSLGLGF